MSDDETVGLPWPADTAGDAEMAAGRVQSTEVLDWQARAQRIAHAHAGGARYCTTGACAAQWLGAAGAVARRQWQLDALGAQHRPAAGHGA
nr:hypothetical protein [Comamonas jiangduensis]